jgi:hypothetical protein
MQTKKPKVNINIESLFVGDEPTWGDKKTELPLTRALSWYSNQLSEKESKKYTLDYVKSNKYSKEIIDGISSASDSLFKNLGFVCRIMQRGAELDKSDWVNYRIKEILDFKLEDVVDSQVVPSKLDRTIQDRVFDQTTQYINDIEEHVDNFIKNKTSDFKCYDWLVANSIKPIYLKHIQDHYNPLIEELTLTINKQDEQLIESYSHWSKKELNSYLSFITSIIKDCENFGSNVKTVRKVKKKKVITLDKKVAKVQYKKEDNEYKLASIAPTEIIGAMELWVFNTKYKKLGHYKAIDDSGFGIKGTTLLGYDETFSIQKTLRKPLEILTDFKKAKKPELKKFMANIKCKEAPLNGRINSDTILLKVVR